ncbi:MAG TPA: flagellar basal body P-ring formation chaperone FlgA [Xanthobacteraceae bacterium]|nr:flagellar basal body P-ring formation chaperone FlgA [Xanthobacteraceae bacterium]
MLRVACIAACLALVPGAAAAQSTGAAAAPVAKLRHQAVVSSDVVRIGDLIDGAGAAAGIAIFRAPDLGETGSVPAYRVLDAARAHGLVEVDAQGNDEVTVTRAGRVLATADIAAAISRALAGRAGTADPTNLTVAFDRDPQPLHLEAAGELRAAYISYSARSGRFDIVLEPTGDAGQRAAQRYSGYAIETLPVAVPVRALARGEIVKAADVTIERRPKADFRDGAAAAAETAGLAVRHAVRAGQPLRVSDLMRPELVQRNEAVTLVYQAPGMVLTIRGKAMDSGAEGDLVNVLNTQSNRTVQGTVAGPARVIVRTGAARVAAGEAAPESVNPAEP